MYRQLISIPVWVYGLAALSFVAALVIAPNTKLVSEAFAAQSSVSMVDMTFSPGTITVAAGDTVTWTNNSSLQHTVTADDGSFDSGTINAGGTYSHTFMTPGTYRYYCRFHGAPGGVGMSGTIVVTGSNTNTQPTQSNTQQNQPMPGMQMMPANTSYTQPSYQQPASYQQPNTQSYTSPAMPATGYAPIYYSPSNYSQRYQPNRQRMTTTYYYLPCHTSYYQQSMQHGYSHSKQPSYMYSVPQQYMMGGNYNGYPGNQMYGVY